MIALTCCSKTTVPLLWQFDTISLVCTYVATVLLYHDCHLRITCSGTSLALDCTVPGHRGRVVPAAWTCGYCSIASVASMSPHCYSNVLLPLALCAFNHLLLWLVRRSRITSAATESLLAGLLPTCTLNFYCTRGSDSLTSASG